MSAGDAHERQSLASLIADGKHVRNLKATRESLDATAQVMAEGVDVIYQAIWSMANLRVMPTFSCGSSGDTQNRPYVDT